MIVNSIKKVAVRVRKFVKIGVLLTVAILIILGIIKFTYRQTYTVSLNGEVIGYTNNKVALQKKINDYITSGNGEDVAFVEITDLPTYEACLIKKDVETNDDEIFNKVIENGTSYYKYYALTIEDEEKSYVKQFADAEEVVKQLKDKDSANQEELGIVEKYDTKMAEITPVENCVEEMYEEKVVIPEYSYSSSSAYENIGKTVIASDSVPTDLGVSLIHPISGIITSRFGIRSRDNHQGLDIAAPEGTAIKAACAGTVIFSGCGDGYEGYGNLVIVQSSDSLSIRYAHCSKLYVQVGERVEQGQVIAAVGSTGISTGDHLHFEIRYNGSAIDPQNYVYN